MNNPLLNRQNSNWMTPRKKLLVRIASRFRLLAFVSAFLAFPNQLSADEGSSPSLSFMMSNSVVDGQGGNGNPTKITAGTAIDYSVAIIGGSMASTFSISNPIPSNMALYVRDLTGAASGPIAIDENSSELEIAFEGLENQRDSIEFSNDGGVTFDYSPVADAKGYDDRITYIKITPSGLIASSDIDQNRFVVRYRLKVK